MERVLPRTPGAQALRRVWPAALVAFAALAGMLALASATRAGIGIAPDSVSYLEAARNLAAGRGLATAEDGDAIRPLTRFPPLYPAALAAFVAFGADPRDAARWLAIALLGANAALAGALVARCAPGARWLPALGAALLASSPEIAMLHGTALSEPLFLLLGFSGLLLLSRHLETASAATLVAAALAVALACLTRYAGAALIAAGALALLIAPDRALRRRIATAALFAALAALPIAIWTLRNHRVGAPATGRSIAFHPIGTGALRLALRSIGQWLLFGRGGAAVAWLLGAGVLVAAGFALRSRAALARILALFAVAYLLFLAASISFFDAQTPLNGRILSPLFVAGLVLALSGLGAALRVWRSRAPAVVGALLGVAFALAYAAATGDWIHQRAALGGEGFGSLAWRQSETMQRVADLPAQAPVYSNGRDAIYALTGRAGRWIPAPIDAESRQPRAAYTAEIEALRAALRDEGASLVWFDRIDWRWYLPARRALFERLPVRREADLGDGEIWRYDPARDAPPREGQP